MTTETKKQPENTEDKSIRIDNSIISTEALAKREKEKAKVRITAYQAMILMDGIDPALDEIDSFIMAAIKKNQNTITYKLTGLFAKNPYMAQIKSNLLNRGFNVTSTSYDSTVTLKISWVSSY